jgi:hypothetical protein
VALGSTLAESLASLAAARHGSGVFVKGRKDEKTVD